MSDAPRFVLILGSYDVETKRLIYELKDEVSKRYGKNDVFSLVLDKVEVFTCDNLVQVVAEMYESTLTVMVFKGIELVDVDEISDVSEAETEDRVMDYLSEGYGSKGVLKLPVLGKLDLLMNFSVSICLIREKELTRGGEYCELVHVSL
jgi:hypothetical protein